MKKLILTTLTLFCFAGVFAQMSNVVMFTENGERFTAILNGLRMNDEPVTNLKVEDLNQPAYKLKVIFENKDLGEMDKNLYCQPGEETVYMIKQNKKGDYKLAMRSSVPIAQAVPMADNTYLYHWGGANTNNQVTTPVNTGPAVTTTVVEETTTTTTGTTMGTTTNTGTGENVSMDVNVDGFGMSVNINTNDNMGTTDAGVMTTTTTTTTTSTGGTIQDDVVYVEEVPPCAAMGSGDFESARASIKSKSFSDSKMTLAKQVTRNHCLSAMQVKGIAELFDFEDDRLEYAKFAHEYCFEQNKYYQVNDAFEFESSIEELDEYINGR
jgi:hypothetical protein